MPMCARPSTPILAAQFFLVAIQEPIAQQRLPATHSETGCCEGLTGLELAEVTEKLPKSYIAPVSVELPRNRSPISAVASCCFL